MPAPWRAGGDEAQEGVVVVDAAGHAGLDPCRGEEAQTDDEQWLPSPLSNHGEPSRSPSGAPGRSAAARRAAARRGPPRGRRNRGRDDRRWSYSCTSATSASRIAARAAPSSSSTPRTVTARPARAGSTGTTNSETADPNAAMVSVAVARRRRRGGGSAPPGRASPPPLEQGRHRRRSGAGDHRRGRTRRRRRHARAWRRAARRPAPCSRGPAAAAIVPRSQTSTNERRQTRSSIGSRRYGRASGIRTGAFGAATRRSSPCRSTSRALGPDRHAVRRHDDVDVDALARSPDACSTTARPGSSSSARRASQPRSPRRARLVSRRARRSAATRGRPLIVGAGTNSTRTTIDEVATLARRRARRRRPARRGAVLHAAVGGRHHRPLPSGRRPRTAPIVAYNIPYRTGRRLGADALLELAATPASVSSRPSAPSTSTRSPCSATTRRLPRARRRRRLHRPAHADGRGRCHRGDRPPPHERLRPMVAAALDGESPPPAGWPPTCWPPSTPGSPSHHPPSSRLRWRLAARSPRRPCGPR